jgi:iron complex transport system ATP-binding protein
MSDHSIDLPGLRRTQGLRPARSGPGQAIITLSGISFSYNGAKQTALRGLTLEIPEGAITAVLGPNGSGKTTLLRLVLGVLRPQQGAIAIADQAQASYSRRELGQLVGLVPQDEHIPFDFSILEYVLLGRAPYLKPLAMPGEADHRVAVAALQATGLDDMRDRPLPNLSGGERQLAVVARALAQQPRVLLMDEPTTHLDLRNKGRLLQIMRDLAGQGYTLVLTTHDPNVAAAVATHVVLIRSGQILDSGPSQTMLTTERLAETYGLPVQVYEIGGRRLILLP